MRRMKTVAALLSLIVAMLMTTSTSRPVSAGINTWRFLEPAFQGTDDFYDTSVIAYVAETTAKLVVSVDADPFTDVNISRVWISFDWGKEYNSTEASESSPLEINSTHPVHVFVIDIPVPSTVEVSNWVLRGYTVHVNYTNGVWTDSGTNFAVYSADQADAQALNQMVDAYPSSMTFSSAEADILWEKAKNSAAMGDTYYQAGAFISAKSTYQTALNLFDQAFTAETTYTQNNRQSQTNLNNAWASYYNALANASKTEADAAMKQADAKMAEVNATKIQADAAAVTADAALTNASGWLAFGIGWIFIGIGVIIYGLRKPKLITT